jgi:hypothetical protein
MSLGLRLDDVRDLCTKIGSSWPVPKVAQDQATEKGRELNFECNQPGISETKSAREDNIRRRDNCNLTDFPFRPKQGQTLAAQVKKKRVVRDDVA